MSAMNKDLQNTLPLGTVGNRLQKCPAAFSFIQQIKTTSVYMRK